MECMDWCSKNEGKGGATDTSYGSKIKKMPLSNFMEIHNDETGNNAYELRPDGVDDCSDVDPQFTVNVKENFEASKEGSKYIWEKINNKKSE